MIAFFLKLTKSRALLVSATLSLSFSHSSFAGDFTLTDASVNTVWLATASAMVFLMQAGFALLESGASRSKNCINIVMKNYLDLCFGSIVFFLVGYGLMFGSNPTGWFGTDHFAMHNAEPWDYSFLLFQMMFAATAATIVSGAVAERARFAGYLIGVIVIVTFIYPVFGSWAWGSLYEGSGWLAELGFIDFAGSTVVHSVGGWAALAAISVLGPRLGRFGSDGKPHDIPGHNLNFVALGGLILWFGWFGFNGGSTGSADVAIGLINLNTQLSAACGAAGAVLISVMVGKPVLVSTVVNGSLAGLVGVTAGCASMEPVFACITGFSAAIFAFFVSHMLLRMGLDDVVGAVSVHGVAGAWGTLCAGMFLTGNMFDLKVISVQLMGIAACFLWTFCLAYITFFVIHKCGILRMSNMGQQRGLDFAEHAEVAYPELIGESAYNTETYASIEK